MCVICESLKVKRHILTLHTLCGWPARRPWQRQGAEQWRHLLSPLGNYSLFQEFLRFSQQQTSALSLQPLQHSHKSMECYHHSALWLGSSSYSSSKLFGKFTISLYGYCYLCISNNPQNMLPSLYENVKSKINHQTADSNPS